MQSLCAVHLATCSLALIVTVYMAHTAQIAITHTGPLVGRTPICCSIAPCCSPPGKICALVNILLWTSDIALANFAAAYRAGCLQTINTKHCHSRRQLHTVGMSYRQLGQVITLLSSLRQADGSINKLATCRNRRDLTCALDWLANLFFSVYVWVIYWRA